MKTAILVDGGFYRKRSTHLWGERDAEERANELFKYCTKHITIQNLKNKSEKFTLYRIFYYDCATLSKKVYNPLTARTEDLSKTSIYQWSLDFYDALRKKRKVALRMGELAESSACYFLKNEPTKKLFRGEISLCDITENDFSFKVNQKGVDMRIGLDIASLAFKKQADQIILKSHYLHMTDE